MSFALYTFPPVASVFDILRQEKGGCTLTDAQLYATRALPCLVGAAVPPDIVIGRVAEAEPVGATAVANMAAHTDRSVGVAREVLRVLRGQLVCW